MNINRQTPTGKNLYRNTAIAAGFLYLLTHVTSIGAVILYDPLLKNTSYLLGAGSDGQILVGTIFDILLAIGVIGTAVALFPVVRKWNESIALGYVGLRTLEAGIIAVGVIPLLAAVTLRQNGMGDVNADPATLIALGNTFVAFYDWTAVLGPGLVCGVNTVLMAYLMYKSRLVPRFIPILGLVGGPLVFALSVAKMFGTVETLSVWAGIAVIPIFTWEVSLAIWLITKGFRFTTEPESAQITPSVVRHVA